MRNILISYMACTPCTEGIENLAFNNTLYFVDKKKVGQLCRKNRIMRLSLFGSVLRPDFRPESDVDVLVEFDAGHTPSMFGIVNIEKELIGLLGGRKVDLRTPEDLSRYFRQKVLQEAEVQYARG